MAKSQGYKFPYELPDGGLWTRSYIVKNKLVFQPRVQELRYMTTKRIIQDPRWRQPLKKIIDFGCGEMNIVPLLRAIPFVEHIVAVDVNKEVLTKHMLRIYPHFGNFFNSRETPLRIEILHGSIIELDERLRDADVVLGLELLQQLTQDDLEKVPENVFKMIQPKIAIFTTPNIEFNYLIESLKKNGFRHDDHKFEWTRAQFQSWAFKICEHYSNYRVTFLDLGEAPKNYERLGYDTHMALFVRVDILHGGKPKTVQQQKHAASQNKWVKTYEEIAAIDYPLKPEPYA